MWIGAEVMGTGMKAVGMGTVFMGMGGGGVKFLSLCRPLLCNSVFYTHAQCALTCTMYIVYVCR